MHRRPFLAALTAASLVLLSAVVGGALSSSPAQAATTHPMFLTFYGWWDNTPPGGAIAYPQIHNTAGGKGTYADPITFATSTKELKAGTRVWVPRVRKYFIMEDSCSSCEQEWTGQGPNGGPKLRHIDLWIGGKGGNPMDAIGCEDALTHYNADNTPTMEPVVVDPPANEQVDATPLFNTSTGACYGGAKPNTTLGQYTNGSTGQCLNNPNNSTTPGTQLKTAACADAPSQKFTFSGGAFMLINNLCAAISGGKVVLQKCTGGPQQQWSINPNGTISDMQTNRKCFRVSGTDVVAASCSGPLAKWTFKSATPNDFTISVNPLTGKVSPGGAPVTATVSTASISGTAQSITLTGADAPAGVTVTFDPASVTAGGTTKMTVSAAAGTISGTTTVNVTGVSPTAMHRVAYRLTVG